MAILSVVAAAWLLSDQAAAEGRASAPSCAGTAASHKLSGRIVVAFGDGATWGVNASRNCAASTRSARPFSAHLPGATDTTYPADLGRDLHATVLDYGVRGEATDAGLKRIAGVLSAVQPSEVLVLAGFQDLLRGDTPAVVASRLILMGQLIQSYGARPVLLTLYPPPRIASGKVASLDRFITNQSRLHGFTVIDLAKVVRGHPHALAAGLYPTDRGYALIARAIATALTRSRRL